MENKSNYEKNLENNITRLMMERNLSPRALSKKIWMNDWYITRMLNGKINPSLNALFHIAEALRVEPADDIKTVQENLGHATASFTLDVFGHVTDQMKRESAARMEKFILSVSQ